MSLIGKLKHFETVNDPSYFENYDVNQSDIS